MTEELTKTKIVSLGYNCMFKAVFSNNKYMLSRLVQAILDYLEININVMDKELIIKNNELSLNNVHNRQLICDYFIRINNELELNVEVNRSHYPGLEERNIAYRFNLVEQDALERGHAEGHAEGVEQNTKDTILAMVENKISMDIISKVTNKSIDEIKEIINSFKDE